jgi:hypothetical protein
VAVIHVRFKANLLAFVHMRFEENYGGICPQHMMRKQVAFVLAA